MNTTELQNQLTQIIKQNPDHYKSFLNLAYNTIKPDIKQEHDPVQVKEQILDQFINQTFIPMFDYILDTYEYQKSKSLVRSLSLNIWTELNDAPSEYTSAEHEFLNLTTSLIAKTYPDILFHKNTHIYPLN